MLQELGSVRFRGGWQGLQGTVVSLVGAVRVLFGSAPSRAGVSGPSAPLETQTTSSTNCSSQWRHTSRECLCPRCTMFLPQVCGMARRVVLDVGAGLGRPVHCRVNCLHKTTHTREHSVTELMHT